MDFARRAWITTVMSGEIYGGLSQRISPRWLLLTPATALAASDQIRRFQIETDAR
jgi:hypothetical protein